MSRIEKILCVPFYIMVALYLEFRFGIDYYVYTSRVRFIEFSILFYSAVHDLNGKIESKNIVEYRHVL